MLVEIYRELQQLLQVALVDLKAAFDFVDRTALWKAMHCTLLEFLLGPDYRLAHAQMRLYSRLPLYIIHDYLRCKSGLSWLLHCFAKQRTSSGSTSVVKSVFQSANILLRTLTMLTTSLSMLTRRKCSKPLSQQRMMKHPCLLSQKENPDYGLGRRHLQ